jgi:hypothetical protein
MTRASGAGPAVCRGGAPRTARQPVVEVAQDHKRHVADCIQIRQQLLHLESALIHAQAEMSREHMNLEIAHLNGGRQRAARLAAFDGTNPGDARAGSDGA